jgi:hypothetical protein
MTELPLGVPLASSTNQADPSSNGPAARLVAGTVGSIGGRSSRLGQRRLEAVAGSLSPRDLAVLQSVRQLRLATSRHLEQLHFVRDATPTSAARKCRRVLRRLHEIGLLRRLERTVGGLHAGSAGFIYSVTAAGRRLLSEPGSRLRRAEPSLPFVGHTLAIADLYVEVHELTDGDDYDLLALETEPNCWRRWSGLGGEPQLLRPDLYVALGIGADEVRHFVEVDLGTEHRPALVRKARAYQGYYESGVEQQRDGIFPRVTWLVPDPQRVRLLEQAFTTDRSLSRELFLVATLDHGVRSLVS